MAAAVGAEVPVWDIRDEFGDTDLLVTTNAMGDSLAKTLGSRRVCLMRGHGAAVAAHDLKATVFVSIYLMINAALLKEAREMGQVTALSEGEIRLTAETTLSEGGQARAWEYWARRAGFTTTVND
jgi:HCOMODA/2-hydroxy-3-carboxy-muconic semialdehyde decarboxylase